MNVIFLDIDGVMNSEVFYCERYKKRWKKFETYKWLLTSKVNYALNGFKPKIYSFANFKINPNVWEFDYVFKRLKEETDPLKWKWLSDFCNINNYKICISSVWKNHFKDINQWNDALIKLGFNNDIFVGITCNKKTIRGEEIKDWIDNNNVESYAIIDVLYDQMKSFFYVDSYYGLTPNILYRIHKHFNKQL